MQKTDVLIVGAGPTGLVLAIWLSKMGVSVRIIDQADRSGTTSRAIVLHARNLEFYRQLGFASLAIERGVEFKAANLWLHGKKFAHVPFGDLGVSISPYPYALILPQDQQEELLGEQLRLLGVEVERSTTLFSCENIEKGVRARLKKATGEEEICEALYLAGCDGAHSVVREQLGVGFPGGTYEDVFYVADLRIQGAVADGEMHGALDDADFLAIFPMKGKGNVRLVGAIRPELKQKEHVQWEDVNQKIIQRLSMKVEEVKWFSAYKVHHRVASQFQKERIFLLGDAAHIHSPVGGQGMNTGIGDAVNLAWKLVAVIKAHAPAALLETYNEERIRFAQHLVSTTDSAFSFVSKRGRLATQVRTQLMPLLLPFLFQFAAMRRMMFRILSQTSIEYEPSSLSEGKAGQIKAGDRLPWLNGKPDNYEVLNTMNWQMHVYGKTAAEVQHVCKERNIDLHVFKWSDEVKKVGLQQDTLYLIRPDGYIGWIQAQWNKNELFSYLDKWGI
ncbi:MAG: FAD-dependent oxidoreductase [Chitinophagaceae bacterium]|nr:FAD-dependent oxidoreductase [Chitinophagaceae bacterium]